MAATDEQIIQMAAEINIVKIIGEEYGIKSNFMEGMEAGLIAAYYGYLPEPMKMYLRDCLNTIGTIKENYLRHAIDERYDVLKESFAAQRLRDQSRQ